MLITLLTLLFIIILLHTVLLGGSVIFGTAGMLLCVAGIVLKVVLGVKGRILPARLSAAGGLILAFACTLLMTGVSKAGSGSLSYKSKLLDDMADAKNAKDAEKQYEEYKMIYGEDDDALLCLAKYYINENDKDKSSSLLGGLKDKESLGYYLTYMEWSGKFNENASDDEIITMLDAVTKYPTWAKGNLLLGLSYYKKGDEDSAAYYLKKARQLDDTDPYAVCYLGILSYDRANYVRATYYLKEAERLAKGDDYLLDIIHVYQELVGREVDS